MAIMEAIETVYLEVDAASVTFDSISGYEHLQLRFSERANGPNGAVYMQFNDDTGNNYAYQQMSGSASSATGNFNGASTTQIALIGTTNKSGGTNYGGGVIDILDYANPNKNTSVQCSYGSRMDTASQFVVSGDGLWDNIAAVTKIKFYEFNGWKRGSSFTLYGIKSS
jgi:hypothetical protein